MKKSKFFDYRQSNGDDQVKSYQMKKPKFFDFHQSKRVAEEERQYIHIKGVDDFI